MNGGCIISIRPIPNFRRVRADRERTALRDDVAREGFKPSRLIPSINRLHTRVQRSLRCYCGVYSCGVPGGFETLPYGAPDTGMGFKYSTSHSATATYVVRDAFMTCSSRTEDLRCIRLAGNFSPAPSQSKGKNRIHA